MSIQLDEVRGWIQLSVFVVGGTIALRTYVVSQRQRRLENSLKLLEIFYGNLESNDLEDWKSVFMGSSEPAGAKHGYFYMGDGLEIPLDSLFSEGPADNGAVDRIVQQIDLIAYQALRGTIDVQFIYSQVGQLIDSTYKWFGDGESSVIACHYPHYEKFHKKYGRNFSNWPKKVFSYIE